MDIKTIICPNCGASTSNFHNCEYCGSFLVQKASQGVDMSDYVQSSKAYYNEGFVSVFKNFVDFCKRYPKKIDDFILGIAIDNETMPINIFVQEGKGMVITLLEQELSALNAKRLFLNSSAFSVFTVNKAIVNDAPSHFDEYTAIFGYDYEGAALVCLQLLQEVFKPEPENVAIQTCLVEGDCWYDINGCLTNYSSCVQSEEEVPTNWPLVIGIVIALAIGIGIYGMVTLG